MIDQLERLTNLVALLLETRVPLTLVDIDQRLEGQYPAAEQARRAAFERDKSAIRSVGIPLEQQVLGGQQAGQTGYWIDRARYELQDLGLTDDERRSLQVALAAVRLGEGWADDAILKLGGSAQFSSPGTWAATLDSSENLPTLHEARVEGRVAEFTYRDRPRALEPWGLLSRNGFWYVIGLDRETGTRRTYRVDRIEGEVTTGEPSAFTVPEDFDLAAAFEESVQSIGVDDGPTEAEVLVDADRAQSVLMELDPSAVVESRPDGSIVVRVPCRNRLVFRAWVLGFVDHAEVLGPPEVRNEIVDWLREMVARG
jgi:predicted DNA-binding transcriptional regulator YafY